MKKGTLLKIGLIIAILLLTISIYGCSGTNAIENKRETVTISSGNFEEYFNVNISVDSCNIEEYDTLGLPSYNANGQMTITITPKEDLEVENLVVGLSLSDGFSWDIDGANEIGEMELTLPTNGSLTKTVYCNGDSTAIKPEYLTGSYTISSINTNGTIKV